MSVVQESITIGRARRNPHKPSWLTTNMIVAYTLLVIEEVIPSTHRKLNSVQRSRCGRTSWWKKWVLRNYQSCPRERRWSVVSGYLQKNMDLSMVILYATKPDW